MKYSKLWLAYDRPIKCTINEVNINFIGNSPMMDNAVSELRKAFGSVLLSTSDHKQVSSYNITLAVDEKLSAEEYLLECKADGCIIKGGGGAGVLYGTFAFLRRLVTDGGFSEYTERVSPASPIRMLDHWDNIDGSIERGYSGRSFFFKDGELLVNDRTHTYARLMASVGINAVAINNVNVRNGANRLITSDYAYKLNEMGRIFSGYGIKLFLSVDFSSPISVGGLPTSDPCDPAVAEWWRECARELYSSVTGLGGFLVKADSEGQPGPFAYGRDHADGANMLARAIAPFGGAVIWRCFVYNCAQDWRDRTTDRACSGARTFAPLDGKFDDNVILQVKNGPMDFQIREPVHPLFGAMKKTNLMMEFQIAQEYTGQQRHVCCLIPMFKEILDFRTYSGVEHDTVGDIVCGRAYGNRLCGITAVSNTGDDYCWTGSELAAANLYGFGRLAFDPSLSAEQIITEWCGLMFADKTAAETVKEILLGSYKAYEDYTVPLGIGWMCKPNNHYGPDPWGYEFDRWGTYNRADRDSVGVDRGPSGTGYSELYNEPLKTLYSSPETCPDELKLFFCRLDYNYRLKSGKTVIQHIYDTHFEGYEKAEEFARAWDSLKGKVPDDVFKHVKERFDMQLRSALEWRDIINTFFFRLSGIPDEKGRPIY